MGFFGVLFLIIFIAFLIYFVGGVILMKIRGASGLELIPNYRFWLSVMMKISSGVRWLMNGCKTASEGYEEI